MGYRLRVTGYGLRVIGACGHADICQTNNRVSEWAPYYFFSTDRATGFTQPPSQLPSQPQLPS